MQRLYSTLLYLITYFTVIIIIFLLLELFTRIIFPGINYQGTDKRLIINRGEGNGYGLKPNINAQSFGKNISTDKYGFRRNNFIYNKEKPNWLLLGDSVVMGVGVNEDSTFSSHLSSKLKNWNILNGGVIGYSSEDYVLQLNHALQTLKIQRVSLFFCLNDIYNRESGIIDILPGETLRKLFGHTINFLRMNSALYLLIKNIIFDRSKNYFEFDNNLYIQKEELLYQAINNLIKIKNILKNNNIPFEIYLLPYEYQLRNPHQTSIKQPQLKLMNSLKNYSIIVKDMFNYMLQNSNGYSKELFLYGDPMHLSNKGHRIVSNFILLNLKNFDNQKINHY